MALFAVGCDNNSNHQCKFPDDHECPTPPEHTCPPNQDTTLLALKELGKSIIKTTSKPAYEIDAKVDLTMYQSADPTVPPLESPNPSPLVELDLKAQVIKKNTGTETLITADIGGLAAMMLGSQKIIYLNGVDEYLYSKDTSMFSGEVSMKYFPDAYLAKLSELSELIGLIAITGIDITLNTDIDSMAEVAKEVVLEEKSGEKIITLKLDLAKILPKNVVDGKSIFTDESVVITINADGILKNITAKIASRRFIDGNDTACVINLSADLTKTSNVTIIPPEGYQDFKLFQYNELTRLAVTGTSFSGDKIKPEMNALINEDATEIAIMPTLINDDLSEIRINGTLYDPAKNKYPLSGTSATDTFTIVTSEKTGRVPEFTYTLKVAKTYKINVALNDLTGKPIADAYLYFEKDKKKTFISYDSTSKSYIGEVPVTVTSGTLLSDKYNLGTQGEFTNIAAEKTIAIDPVASIKMLTGKATVRSYTNAPVDFPVGLKFQATVNGVDQTFTVQKIVDGTITSYGFDFANIPYDTSFTAVLTIDGNEEYNAKYSVIRAATIKINSTTPSVSLFKK